MKPRITTFIVLGLLAAAPVRAEWPHDPYTGNPIDVTPAGCGLQRTVADGAGGAFVIYQQAPDGGDGAYDLLVRRVDHQGELVWGGAVLVHDGTPTSSLASLEAVSDGAGGVLVVYSYLAGGTFYPQSVQRISGTGSLLWGPGGTAAIAGPATFSTSDPQIAADGAGGAFLVWQDSRNYGSSNNDIWAQRFDAGGSRQWGASGVAVCGAVQNQYQAVVCADDAGGAIVAWADYRSGTDYDIYGQRLAANGSPLWSVDGKRLYVNGAETDIDPVLVPAGIGSEFFLVNRRYEAPAYNVQCARYTALGDAYWYTYVSGDPGIWQYDPAAIGDGNGGVFVVWRDARDNGYAGYQLYAQHLGAGGNAQFASSGTLVAPAAGSQYDPSLALDGTGGLLVAWEDLRNINSDIYGQRLSPTGARMWDYSGTPISQINSEDDKPAAVADGAGGMIVGFTSYQFGYYKNLFAQRIGYHGRLGFANPTLTAVTDLPQDQGGRVRLDWDRSYLDDYSYMDISDYTVWQRYGGGAKGLAPTGADQDPAHVAEVTGLAPAAAAARLAAGWLLLDHVTPYLRESYAYDASTYADSTAAGIVWTEFQILAHASQFFFWESNIVAGYSVDNLAPGMPLALSASWVAPDGLLAWSPGTVSVPDLQGYRLYRSATPGFVPGPATFIGTTTDTTFVDPALAGGDWYYRVTARDIHDNESEPSNEAQLLAASGVGDDALPAAFRLAAAVPNPFNPSTLVRFSLAQDGPAAVDVLDLQGRHVRTLVAGAMSAGEQTVRWDGRDDAGRGVSSGAYFIRLRAGDRIATRKVTLMK
ncbi:T9SS type A sorting domain-containing protein [bacterium]|nr:T9SS type A sorting domain-containing protein [bacterium]